MESAAGFSESDPVSRSKVCSPPTFHDERSRLAVIGFQAMFKPARGMFTG